MMQPLRVVAAGSFLWRLQPEFAQRLGPEGVRLQDWLRAGRAKVVKQGPHRVVYRVALDGVTFYLKHNLTPDRVTWLRQLVRPSKGRREYTSAMAAAARGIPTAFPLAWAQERGLFGNGESVLITRSLDDTQQLNLFVHQVLPTLTAERQAHIRRQLAHALGRFVARMHDAGIRHNDLHAGNLLIRLNAGDALELFLIDLNDVHFGPTLTWRQSLANLVILNHWFILQASRADRFRFWRSYLRARPLSWSRRLRPRSPEVHHWARRLEQATWQSLQKLWQRRDRRCLVDNRYYRCLDAAHATGHVVTDLDPELTATLLSDPDAPFRRSDVVRYKDSPGSTVVEFTGRVNGRVMRLIYKRFGVKKTSTAWTSLVRMPPALRSWQLGQGFRERGLPTARPLLVLHRRRRGMYHEGYLLTEKIEAAHHLHDCLTRLGSLPAAERRRWLRVQIPRLAHAVREMHRRQVSHRDLKSPNIMLAESACAMSPPPAGATPSLFPVPMAGIWFLDLAGASLHARLGSRRRVQNLTRLNAGMHEQRVLTRTDRLRFLRSYLQWGLFGKHGWKKWWKAVARATQDKLERNQRVGRWVA